MFSLNMVDYSMSFPYLSTFIFYKILNPPMDHINGMGISSMFLSHQLIIVIFLSTTCNSDQRISKYTTSTKSRKWMKKVFSYILDTARQNSQTVLAKNRGEDPRKFHSGDFLWNLALGLVLPHIIRRRHSPGFKHMQTDAKVCLGFSFYCQAHGGRKIV